MPANLVLDPGVERVPAEVHEADERHPEPVTKERAQNTGRLGVGSRDFSTFIHSFSAVGPSLPKVTKRRVRDMERQYRRVEKITFAGNRPGSASQRLRSDKTVIGLTGLNESRIELQGIAAKLEERFRDFPYYLVPQRPT